MPVVKLDERILRHFKIGVFLGLRRSNRGLHRAFFIDAKQAGAEDIGRLLSGLDSIPSQMRKAYEEVALSHGKVKKRKRGKKTAGTGCRAESARRSGGGGRERSRGWWLGGCAGGGRGGGGGGVF